MSRPGQTRIRRIRIALIGLAAVISAGTLGYRFLPVTADGVGFSVLEALYQTITTVATVGFREVHPLSTVGQVFTMCLIILGAGTVLYNLGLLVEAMTEGHLTQLLERRAMDRQIAALRGHVIVCGFGRVGRATAEHLTAAGHQVVLIDQDANRFDDVDLPHLTGDASDDGLLAEAGIDHARALVGCLDTDADTVYLVLSARALQPDLTIVARARTAASKQKLVLAGATRAVNPQLIGGRRLAAFALQPHVAEFMDVVMHDEDLDYRIQQVSVHPDSAASGCTLADLELRDRAGVQILAMRSARSADFTFNPPGDQVITPGAVLIAFGTRAGIALLEDLATSSL